MVTVYRNNQSSKKLTISLDSLQTCTTHATPNMHDPCHSKHARLMSLQTYTTHVTPNMHDSCHWVFKSTYTAIDYIILINYIYTYI